MRNEIILGTMALVSVVVLGVGLVKQDTAKHQIQDELSQFIKYQENVNKNQEKINNRQDSINTESLALLRDIVNTITKK